MGLSERRACSIVGADRKMVRYRSRRPPDTALRAQLRNLANERRRFGYRRLLVLLPRDGESSGINRIYRLYREESLKVCSVRQGDCRRNAGTDPCRSEGQCALVIEFRQPPVCLSSAIPNRR